MSGRSPRPKPPAPHPLTGATGRVLAKAPTAERDQTMLRPASKLAKLLQ